MLYQKPLTPGPLAASNPIIRGLVSCLVSAPTRDMPDVANSFRFADCPGFTIAESADPVVTKWGTAMAPKGGSYQRRGLFRALPTTPDLTTCSVFVPFNSSISGVLVQLGGSSGEVPSKVELLSTGLVKATQGQDATTGVITHQTAVTVGGINVAIYTNKHEASGAAQALWLNGVKSNTTTSSSAQSGFSADRQYVGQNLSSSKVVGFFVSAVWNRILSDAEIIAISSNPWLLFKQPTDLRLLKASAATGATFGVSANTDPVLGSMAFKSQPAFAVSAITAAVQGAMAFGPASRIAVTATTGAAVGSMGFKSQPVLVVAAVTGQTIGSMGFKAQPSLGVSAQTAPAIGAMAFGPSARLAVSATLAPAVGGMAFVAQPKFAVVAQTAPAVGAMAFGPSSRLTITGQTAPAVGSMAFKAQPVLAVAAQTAPAVGSMAFAVSPQFGVLATLSPVVGSMAFLSGYVADIPGELCLEPRRLGTISSTIRKLGTIHFEARPL